MAELINLAQAVAKIREGEVIAYPTEAVFGLGCDPFNENAVTKLLNLKQRPVDKGLILIAAQWQQFEKLTQAIPDDCLQRVFDSWPGPHTWVFPASRFAPQWITGQHATIALRVTAHPLVQELCALWDGPLVSTSANLAGETALLTAEDVQQRFPKGLAGVLSGEVSKAGNPTEIRDAISNRILRAGN